MSKVFIEEDSLTAIGDAIRAKTGNTDALSVPSGMVDAIGSITTGGGSGGDLNFEIKTITNNGEEELKANKIYNYFDHTIDYPLSTTHLPMFTGEVNSDENYYWTWANDPSVANSWNTENLQIMENGTIITLGDNKVLAISQGSIKADTQYALYVKVIQRYSPNGYCSTSGQYKIMTPSGSKYNANDYYVKKIDKNHIIIVFTTTCSSSTYKATYTFVYLYIPDIIKSGSTTGFYSYTSSLGDISTNYKSRISCYFDQSNNTFFFLNFEGYYHLKAYSLTYSDTSCNLKSLWTKNIFSSYSELYSSYFRKIGDNKYIIAGGSIYCQFYETAVFNINEDQSFNSVNQLKITTTQQQMNVAQDRGGIQVCKIGEDDEYDYFSINACERLCYYHYLSQELIIFKVSKETNEISQVNTLFLPYPYADRGIIRFVKSVDNYIFAILREFSIETYRFEPNSGEIILISQLPIASVVTNTSNTLYLHRCIPVDSNNYLLSISTGGSYVYFGATQFIWVNIDTFGNISMHSIDMDKHFDEKISEINVTALTAIGNRIKSDRLQSYYPFTEGSALVPRSGGQDSSDYDYLLFDDRERFIIGVPWGFICVPIKHQDIINNKGYSSVKVMPINDIPAGSSGQVYVMK